MRNLNTARHNRNISSDSLRCNNKPLEVRTQVLHLQECMAVWTAHISSFITFSAIVFGLNEVTGKKKCGWDREERTAYYFERQAVNTGNDSLSEYGRLVYQYSLGFSVF